MVATGVLAVVALRAEGAAIGRAESVFTTQLGPVIDLTQVIPNARRLLPEAPTAEAASAEQRRTWGLARDEVTAALDEVVGLDLGGALGQRVARAEAAWAEARPIGDQLLAGPASAEDILAFDRGFRRLRAQVAAVLGALQPVVAEPMAAAPAELDRLAWSLAGAIALIAVASLASAYALLRSVLSGLTVLRGVAHELAEGNLDARAPRSFGEFDEVGSVLNLMAERLAVERAALTERATRDGLTGVLNAREIKERIGTEIERARRYGTPVGLVMLDLDHFKRVNDTHGHQVGDQALVSFARSIESALRPTDLVGRYGGEEFAVLLPETDGEGARTVAERVREVVAATPVALPVAGSLSLTTSAGVAWSADGSDEPAELVAVADAALYRAKHDGRNRVVLADDLATPPRP